VANAPAVVRVSEACEPACCPEDAEHVIHVSSPLWQSLGVSLNRLVPAIGLVAVALVIAGCSSGSSETSTASSDATSTPTAATQAFPVAEDGSIITPSGYVFKGEFAICNQAKCAAPNSDGTAQCTCQRLTDTWTLSPVPNATLKQLGNQGNLLSTFTTENVTSANSMKCSGGQWADCYGALCTYASDGTVTCTCPVAKDWPDQWMKYVDDCALGSCTDDLVSVAPLFPETDTSFTDFVAAVKQAGDTVPGIPTACPIP